MNNLTTRKIVLGLLMALVLAFSVQGIADALTFKESRTGDLQTLLPNDKFTIKFSVELTSSDDIFNTETPKQQIAEGTTEILINSSGYAVEYIDGKKYRVSDAATELDEGDGAFVNKKVSGTDQDGVTVVAAGDFVVKDGSSASSATVYVEVDDKAYQVYLRTEKPDTDPVKYEFETLTAVPNKPISSDSEQHHYNDEAILVSVTGGTITSLKRGKTDIPWSTEATAERRSAVDADQVTNQVTLYSLIEETKNRELDTDRTLSSSITLTGRVGGVGTYTIKIFDVTHKEDFPDNEFPVRQAILTFTIYVVPERDETTALTRDVTNEYKFALDRPLRIDEFFGVSSETNIPFRYEVEGSGSIYPAVTYTDGSPTSEGRPAKTLFTSSDAPVFINMNRGSSKVSVYIQGQSPLEKTKIISFIYDYAVLEIIGGNPQVGATGGRLEDPLSVKVTDGNRRPVPGLRVEFDNSDDDVVDASFIPFPGTTVYTDGNRTLASTQADETREATSSSPAPTAIDDHDPIYVQTNSSGEAKVYYQLGSDEEETQDVNVTAAGVTKTFTLDADDDARRASLTMVSMEKATGAGKEGVYYLTVIARSVGGHRISGVVIEFEALSGSLRPRSGTEAAGDDAGPGRGNEIFVKTGADGEAEVEYNVGPTDSTKVVTAEVHDEQQELDYEFILDRVTFDVQHATSSRDPADDGEDDDDEDDEDDTVAPVTVTVPPTVTGTAGGTATLRVTAPATATVTAGGLGNTFLSTNVGSFTRSGTTFTSRLTLPNQVADFSLSVFVNNTRYPVTVSVTAAAAQTGGTLTVAVNPFSGAPGTAATVTVTAADSSNQPANATVSLRATGGTLASSSVLTGTTGTTTVTLTRGSTVGNENYVTVSGPSGYDSVSGRFIIAGPVGRDMTVGAAEELDVYDGNNQSGSLNSPLAEPLVVEVLDANDNPVEDARVRFSTTIGSGRFSPRTPRTDEDGFAETIFTPTSAGRIRISASVAGVDDRAAFTVQAGDPADALVKVSGDNQSGTPGNALASPFVVEVQDEDGEPLAGHSVTFAVTAGGGSLSAMSATADEDGLAETTLTLGSAPGINSVQASVSGVDPVIFSTSIEAKILVAAANRPVMYWIAGGGLYSLSGAKEAKIAESANGVAVGGGKIYWTSQVNASSGAINSANLDGTNATVLTSILAVPMGIAVDTAGSKLYWTNSRGRIQSANLNGSSIKNVMQNLSDPTDIVVSNGFIYWTEGGNSVRRVNISGQKIAIDVAVNLNTVGGLAVGGGKVYWTEMTSASAGTVNGANLNGTNFETLATLLSAPMGISVDTAGSKLYWTNARGRVQSANLNGSMIKNVVEGLISASKITIGGANTETTTVKAATPAKKDNAKYDVNGDGKVDNVDASLVASGLDTGNAKYDVNSDGTVNFLDLLLVFDNRDDNAAAAPAIVGMKLNAIQIDRIEEQIDLLLATNDRSPAALRTLVYMQQLLATARPEKTQLFANYPNPFNPETWIPYELATDTHVKITIYNTQGVVIRTLQFGHQSAGYYTERDRAAYWDGRNALGEQVASGLYFYQLETDEMSSMRKMVILK